MLLFVVANDKVDSHIQKVYQEAKQRVRLLWNCHCYII